MLGWRRRRRRRREQQGSRRSYGSDCRTSKPDSELSRLKKQLSCGYSISTAPQAGQNSSTLVHLYLVLRRFTFNEEFEIIRVYYGAYMVWMDVRLKWDPSEFGNIKELYTNSSLIWTPKFGWVNINADIDSLLKGMAHCLLRWSGYVMCISWSSIHTICQTDITHWPYDSQVCEAQLAPWKLQHEELELLVDGNMRPRVGSQFIEQNRKWALRNAEVEHRRDAFENSTFNYVTITLTLVRHSAAHVATVVIPALVLVLLTLASFWIEAESSSRLCLVCSLFVSHILFLQYTSLSLSNNGNSCPLIVLFYRDSMLICGLSLVVTLVVRWMNLNPAIPPAWVSDFTMKAQESRPGQLLGRLFLQHPRQTADSEGVETPPQGGPNWRLVGTMLDRIGFLAFSVTYFVLMITYYLYYL